MSILETQRGIDMGIHNTNTSVARNGSTININGNNSLDISNSGGLTSNIYSTISNVGSNVGSSLSGFFGSVLSTVNECVPSVGDLFKVGRPVCYHPSIDPDQFVSNYIRSKMAITDLIPVRFAIPFDEVAKNLSSGNLSFQQLIPVLVYDTAISEFMGQCRYHGLSGQYMGLRCYSTDDSGANDSLTNLYTDNFFQEKADSIMSGKLGQVGKALRSMVGSGNEEALKKANSWVRDKVDGVNMDFRNSTENGTLQSMANVAAGFTKTIADMVILGNRISLPQIWDNSDFQPRFSITVKLISPYGHPKAIKEFIIKPFMKLLILAAPKSNDGITYGRPCAVTVTGYGSSYIPLAQIQNISFRRGGGETGYNIYKQPIVVDVTMEFVSLCRGFAALTDVDGTIMDDQGVFGEADKERNVLQHQGHTLLQTVGTMVQSLRPKTPEFNIPSQLGMSSSASPGGIGVGSGLLGGLGGLGNAIGSISNGISTGSISSILGGISQAGSSISGAINTVTSYVKDVRNLIDTAYNTANDIVNGITQPIRDVVNTANNEINNVNREINNLGNEIDNLSKSVHNDIVINNVNNTIKDINGMINSANNVANSTNNLMSNNNDKFPNDIRLSMINSINKTLNQNWVSTGHTIDSCY